MNLGRDKLPWSPEVWNQIDQATHEECKRTKVTAKFLPTYKPISPVEMTAPSEIIQTAGRTFSINEAEIIPLIELWVEFTLTLQQVEREEELGTAMTLAVRAANLISQAVDVTIFGGREAIEPGGKQHPLFRENTIQMRSGPAEPGLLNAPELNPEDPDFQIVPVLPHDPQETPQRYGENTFVAVEDAYRRLQRGSRMQDDPSTEDIYGHLPRRTGLSQSHYGPYALVLHTEPYTDTYAPLPATLLMPGQRIQQLVQWSLGTNTLPPFTGLLVSLGSSTMNLVVGMEATTAFLHEEPDGLFRFRVYERFALRLRDPTAVMLLKFEVPSNRGNGNSEHSDTAIYRITGRVIDLQTHSGVPGLRIESWDKDRIYDDLVDSAVTDAQGVFHMALEASSFQEKFLGRRPDLFFRVFHEDTLVSSTEDAVLWNVGAGGTEIVIEVDMPTS